MAISVAVPKENARGERRVALVPEVVSKLSKSNLRVLVEAGAGTQAFYQDQEYEKAGAEIVKDRASLIGSADIILSVQPLRPEDITKMKAGAIAVGFMNPFRNEEGIAAMKSAKITAFALELVPRITRAQGMDALSSQATAGGYKAALIAADNTPRFLPMLTTAAGTIRPAKVLVLGAGVAGLMAIATSKRLGAMVEAYDVRRAAGEQVRSLGARFLELQINAEGSGGYARELTPEEKRQEEAMVREAVAQADAIITTANIPGKRAPRLVTKEMVMSMKPGSVIVDMAAESGGNCELTKVDEVVVENGVSIFGPSNLPGQVPFHSSQMYAKNLQAFLGLLVTKEGNIVSDFSDEILTGSLLVRNGEIMYGPVKELLEGKK
ncbi:MAG: Re/Si-specific NAD(P)(+) transhydrogenase subunit alpha [Thermoplasmata archaeon]|uniref:proton-translocating NAD(P)(+) transhydrogenase n=1 Tax=Candidatus Sysuiplasma superficiale TaxID=2823368 RepID=A0A8J7YIV6_9ARCH|nr:Re/Si-specific NAD(P)(+) transhydrogenase subunit alpha [Candidatus Sysuiplasma superficiale]MBX8643774.1 Re/Si-specific NAD(P)(+) transhydrogenase subunit alpha [Candidatus Sysuiplasma superficiale]